MSLFVCDTPDCRTVDNTALTMFNVRGDGPAKCSECEWGKWHGRWERTVYDPEASIGSHANPERLYVDGEWVNTPPRRVGHHVGGEFVYEDGHGHLRPYTWVDGVAIWNDELPGSEE